jgi:hypothetical protein
MAIEVWHESGHFDAGRRAQQPRIDPRAGD